MSKFLSARTLSFGALSLALGGAILKRSPAQPNSPANTAAKAVSKTKTQPSASTWDATNPKTFRGASPQIGAPDYPPAVQREFRAAWVATVANMDWPSKQGLSATQQKAEIIRILDRARDLKLNALVWQVRPMCDAFYNSKLEPWSHYLTGNSGQNPGYDPLAFVIEEAHARNIEIHAWFNPYRAGVADKISFAANHVTRTKPQMVLRYGKYLWLDPGRQDVRNYTKKVILDVVNRYEIDGVHLDDYFYPYAEKDAAGQKLPFPDDASYSKYLQMGGNMARDDWRRDNVNRLIEDLYKSVKEQKRWVKFGISPFGIWRPDNPPGIRGMDAYKELYADSRLWWRNGWLDYFAPQLYWSIAGPAQSYPVLLDYWANENRSKRHLWPGHFAQRVERNDFTPQEIPSQIALSRAHGDATGSILFSIRTLLKNPGNINAGIKKLWNGPALVPASPWLDNRAPLAPYFNASWDGAGVLQLKWKNADKGSVANWTLQTRRLGKWTTQVLPAKQMALALNFAPDKLPERVAISAIDKSGNQSAPVLITVK